MLFDALYQLKVGSKMSENTCKVVIQKGKESTASQGIFCTADVDLHIFMLTYRA
jgi:hypothetical protein